MTDIKSRSGFRVIGPNTVTGDLHKWCFSTRELADAFAKQLASDTGAEADVLEYLGSWRPARQPVEFVPAKEKP